MKTNQLILAAALVALAACSKENIQINGPSSLGDNEIGFQAVTRKATKADNAIINGATYDTLNTFKVWGWLTEKDGNEAYSDLSVNDESNFMTNLKIEYTKGRDNSRAKAWRNAQNYYYWPFTGRISFLAIHPSAVAPTTAKWGANDKPKATIDDYTVVGKDSTDLMFGIAEDARRATALPLKFYHALSQIQFRVRTHEDYTVDNVEFKIDSVKINNIDLSGDVAYEDEVITWNNNEDQDTLKVYYKGTQVVTYAQGANDTEKNNNAALYGRALVMVPQPENNKASELDQADPAYDANDNVQTTLTIGYTMKQGNNAEISGTVEVAAPQEWVAGKKYLYTLNFKLDEILFNPTVNDWVKVDVEAINVI
ncbi:MAG: fimbrillin family protein [Bacteroidales bacterium]|nr:fimbrillin family protein [Bacteroidales bacterium]